MTDPMDDLLTDAGRQWRAGQPSPPEPDTARWAGQRGRNRGWVPAVAAAVATMVAAGTAVLLANRPNGAHGGYLAGPAAATAAEALVVRDGDLVQASGTVLSLPGEPVRFCAPIPVLYGSEGRDAAPRCLTYFPVTGVDLDRLSRPASRGGTRWGVAHLVGVWRAGTITVTRQGPPVHRNYDRSWPSRAPCPRPQGGWKSDPRYPPGDPDPRNVLTNYIERQHPDKFRPLRVAHEDGVEVMVVEVVKGDVAQIRSELERRYPGKLCVVGSPGRHSIADQRRVSDLVTRLSADRSNGIYGFSSPDRVHVDVVVLSPQLYDKLSKIGFALLQPDPWLRPVR